MLTALRCNIKWPFAHHQRDDRLSPCSAGEEQVFSGLKTHQRDGQRIFRIGSRLEYDGVSALQCAHFDGVHKTGHLVVTPLGTELGHYAQGDMVDVIEFGEISAHRSPRGKTPHRCLFQKISVCWQVGGKFVRLLPDFLSKAGSPLLLQRGVAAHRDVYLRAKAHAVQNVLITCCGKHFVNPVLILMPGAAILPLLQLGEQILGNRADVSMLFPIAAIGPLREYIVEF